ncbi:MAG: restriction endonuclease subunit S [Lachnospiraceae bacterium]|nr:restriction endonuclease subunit S [Lachnospiraceae bacterium]
MKFADVLDIRNGKNQRQVENPQGKYPIYGSGGLMGYANDYLCDAETVVIGRKGSINNPIFVNEPFWNVDTAFGLVADRQFLLPKYLYYFCVNYNFEKLNTTVTIPSLTKANLLQINIDIPELNIQKSIVEKLDKLTDLIVKKQKEIDFIVQLVKSRFIEMFGTQSQNEKGYMYGTIGDVADIYLGLTHTPTYVNNGVKFISAKNTSGDFLDLSDVKYISQEEFKGAPLGAKPRRGDMLFSRVGSNLGHPVILETDEDICTFVSLGFLRAKGKVTTLYLKHWMRDDFFAEQVRQKVVGGGQPNLNTGWLKEFKVIIPPMELQEQFAVFVQATDKSKLAIQRSLDELEILKKSLMQKYFG